MMGAEMAAPRNQCGACGLEFASVQAFDRHRVGVHAYTLAEGFRMVPVREDGRHCLTESELADIGIVPDRRGVLQDAANADRVRRHFRNAPSSLRMSSRNDSDVQNDVGFAPSLF